eukprot:COSAG02_NODE_1580_length_11851_cov_35.748043_11_plen_65_part_00
MRCAGYELSLVPWWNLCRIPGATVGIPTAQSDNVPMLTMSRIYRYEIGAPAGRSTAWDMRSESN